MILFHCAFEPEKKTIVNPELAKAFDFTVEMVFGIEITAKDEQPLKAFSLISVKLSGRAIYCSEEQFANAPSAKEINVNPDKTLTKSNVTIEVSRHLKSYTYSLFIKI